ncbi:hypothetical protein V2161_03995 [Klebsiella pneumoniae]|uniref:hypothetical protein n=1 Tax=Klebsiella pneumoniae complex TaxID=3390273 RepID=UPI0010823CF9|nr:MULTISPECIES: hypothetical protein [Klebsiella]MBG2720409.1 hypothetical protein [Klebsiella michiganensis]HBW1980527.1 hypothetical protein [Klebsiella quasipneumoniae subsp. similipneumoniae]HCI5948551.1 hypothetical protein [Klebsiella quasipneumoniae subsp. quasipneumoniae]HDT5506055.1 hypothetical protein [Klebsiella pneumoniae subsp. pneumoniae]MBA6173475.1 hypothetical protein [Klebsiella variicola]
MAGNFRIYFLVGDKEYTVEKWLNTDEPTSRNPEVLEAVMAATPPGRAPSILRIVDLGSDGKPMLYDEFRIIDSKGIVYGLVFQKVGHDGWHYLHNYTDFERRPGQPITNDSFTIHGAAGYALTNKNDFPATATINWDRLSVQCNGDEFYLVPWSPLPTYS